MKLHYNPDTDSLHIERHSKPDVETREITDGVNPDLDEHGAVVGLDIDRASARLDPATPDTGALPLKAA